MARRAGLMIAAAVAAGMVIAPSRARAEDVLVVGGSAKEPTQIATVRGAISRALRAAGWVWPDRPATAAEADRLLQCDASGAPWTCIPSTISGVRASEVHRVFVVSIDRSATAAAPMLVLTAKVIVASPPSFVVRQRFCERCSAAQLVQATDDLARQLFRELAARTGRTALEVRSEPPGADVTLDGVHAGTTNTRLAVSPGTHVAVLDKPGFVSETRALTIEDGQVAEVSVTLRGAAPPAPAAGLAAPRPGPRRVVPGLAIASGAALVALGGVALYLGHQGGPEDRYRYTRATAVGVVTGSLGIAAIGAGIYLWRGPDSGLVGQISDTHAVVAWTGRF